MLVLRRLFFTIVVPGTVVVLIPYLVVREGASLREPWTSVQVVSLVIMAAGAAILIRCIWDFAVKGRGTLAPIDPPKHLVVQGLFRYVRSGAPYDRYCRSVRRWLPTRPASPTASGAL